LNKSVKLSYFNFQDEDKAGDVMEFFEALFETELPLVGPFVDQVFELCLAIAADTGLGDPLRAKAIIWLGRVAKVGPQLFPLALLG
jgi:hypothetical protein